MKNLVLPRFGTDGVRGRAIIEITPEYAIALGRAVVRVLGCSRLVIAHDPRLSGPVLEAAFSAGAAAEGAQVDLLGILPTPAVAVISAREQVPGVVVTASHNGYQDNGIKVFAAGGLKVSDEDQQAIEDEVRRLFGVALNGESLTPGASSPTESALPTGFIMHRSDAADVYMDHLTSLFPEMSLQGLRVVIDTANGSMSDVASQVLERLGAEVIVMNNVPDGTNINENCGATDPQALSDFVASVAASNSDAHSSARLSVDLAFAFDGDGDRLIAVDELGNIIDGDRLIALSALDRHQRGQLIGDGVVVTVMSNLGFHRAMEAAGIEVITTPVGDRSVLEAMAQHGLVLGGEQSGHIIHRDLATTGDGLLAAIELALMYRQHHDRDGRSFSNLAQSTLQWFPQVLRNVPVARSGIDPAQELAAAIHAEEVALGRNGRILVRASGTEALVRVMVEADHEDRAQEIAQRLVTLVEAHYSSP